MTHPGDASLLDVVPGVPARIAGSGGYVGARRLARAAQCMHGPSAASLVQAPVAIVGPAAAEKREELIRKHAPMRPIDHLPSQSMAPLAPSKRVAAYCEMLFVDHGIFRLPYLNKHRLGDRAWRSAQPTPHNIRAFAEQGVRTILNLRGEQPCASYRLEREACHRYGLNLVDFHLRSRTAPTVVKIKAALELFERVEYPMLMHCKSGADRTGIMSVLYLYAREGVPLAEAKKQLSPFYGYFRWSRAGILDAFFERYLKANARQPVPFITWVETLYDPEQFMSSFQRERHRWGARRSS